MLVCASRLMCRCVCDAWPIASIFWICAHRFLGLRANVRFTLLVSFLFAFFLFLLQAMPPPWRPVRWEVARQMSRRRLAGGQVSVEESLCPRLGMAVVYTTASSKTYRTYSTWSLHLTPPHSPSLLLTPPHSSSLRLTPPYPTSHHNKCPSHST
jgi:hypothetical protein